MDKIMDDIRTRANQSNICSFFVKVETRICYNDKIINLRINGGLACGQPI